MVLGDNEYVQPEQPRAPAAAPSGSPVRTVGQVRIASKRKRIEHVASQAGMEVEYDALQSFTVAARRVGGRGGGATSGGGRGRGRGGPGASKRAAEMLAAAGGPALPDGGGKKTRILGGPEGSG